MIQDIKQLVSVSNRHLFRANLAKSALVTLLGSMLFSTLGHLILYLARPRPVDAGSIFASILFTIIVTFILTVLPVTFCMTLMIFRLQSQAPKNKLRSEFIIEGVLLGIFVAICMGLLLFLLNYLSIAAGDHVSLTEIAIIFTITGLLTGAFIGGFTTHILLKQTQKNHIK